ncbi:MAG: hypothetical protein ACK5JT_21480 [Hyphomicrobiaceae bacterium]
MRTGQGRKSQLYFSVVIVAMMAAGAPVRAEGDGAARAIAERFAADAAGKAKTVPRKQFAQRSAQGREDEQHRLDEIDMLERARAEAEARRDDMGRIEAQRAAEAAQQLSAERRRAEEAKRVAEEQRRDDEAKQLAAERRRAEEAQRIAEDQRLAQMRRQSELNDRRAEEADALLETLHQARTEREPGFQDGRGSTAHADRQVPVPGDLRSTQVAVLLVMQPGDYGIRRNNKTADPLLCKGWDCYVSNGSGAPARVMSRARAFGVARTLGSRAGACRNSLTCIFRDVDLVSYPVALQPVDMHVIRHDKREPARLTSTSDCRLSGGDLQCRKTFVGNGYSMWVVPEVLARQAGRAALERAIANGLTPRVSDRGGAVHLTSY